MSSRSWCRSSRPSSGLACIRRPSSIACRAPRLDSCTQVDRGRAATLARRDGRRRPMIPRALDLSIPAQLTLALVPDLVLMGGAMLLLVWAAWKSDSDRHQRTIGMASILARRPDDAVHAVVGGAIRRRAGRRRDRARQLPVVRRRRDPARHAVHHRAEHGRQHADRHHRGRDARAGPARVVGHDAARRRARPDDRLPRHRADVDLRLRARRHQPPQRAVGRGRAQVLPARRVLDGVPALRHRARLRRHRHDESHAHRRTHRAVRPRPTARYCSPASR